MYAWGWRRPRDRQPKISCNVEAGCSIFKGRHTEARWPPTIPIAEAKFVASSQPKPYSPGKAGAASSTASGATDSANRIKPTPSAARSEEHTSELQSLMRISYAVFCLKKKKKKKILHTNDVHIQ